MCEIHFEPLLNAFTLCWFVFGYIEMDLRAFRINKHSNVNLNPRIYEKSASDTYRTHLVLVTVFPDIFKGIGEHLASTNLPTSTKNAQKCRIHLFRIALDFSLTSPQPSLWRIQILLPFFSPFKESEDQIQIVLNFSFLHHLEPIQEAFRPCCLVSDAMKRARRAFMESRLSLNGSRAASLLLSVMILLRISYARLPSLSHAWPAQTASSSSSVTTCQHWTFPNVFYSRVWW